MSARARRRRGGRRARAQGLRGRADPRARGHLAADRAGRVRPPHRSVRLRQEHAPEPDRRARPARLRQHRGRRAPPRAPRGPLGLPRGHRRLRVPVAQPDADAERARERPDPDDRPARAPGASARRRARELLGEVGLSERTHASPATLSGGERQRVAIARALANRPRLLLADEPTGALDSETGSQIVALLERLRGQYGTTILLVTNDSDLAGLGDRGFHMRDGRLELTRAAAPRSA